MFIDKLGVLGKNVLGQEHHLLTVHLVSEEVGPEQRGVLIGEIECLVQSDVGVLAQVLVHQMILSAGMIQMGASVLVGSVFAHQGLQKVHCKEFLVLPGRSIEEHTKINVNHLIVPHEKSRGSEIWLISVLLLKRGLV